MRTQAQIEAARANGAKSRGPITHGILSNTLIHKRGTHELFLQHMESFPRRIQTAGCARRSAGRKNGPRPLGATQCPEPRIRGSFQYRRRTECKQPRHRRSGRPAHHPGSLFLRYDARFDRQYNLALTRLLRVRSEKFQYFAKRTQHFVENKVSARPVEATKSQNNGSIGLLSSPDLA